MDIKYGPNHKIFVDFFMIIEHVIVFRDKLYFILNKTVYLTYSIRKSDTWQ